jgi:hypothetical protein
MNKYGHKYGCHTPSVTAETIARLRELTEFEIEDNSWHNDTCDSLTVNECKNEEEGNLKICVWIPNTKKTLDQCEFDEFPHYYITEYECGMLGDEDNINHECDSIEEVADILDEIINGTCRNGKLWKDCDCC